MKTLENIWDNTEFASSLKDGGIAVMPTDTIYGIVGRAEDKETVERIYRIRKRNPERPCIVLIGSIEELEKFSINLSEAQKKELNKFWPGPVSIIFDCSQQKFEYLHRGTNTLAFRLPNNEKIRNFLLETGPLIAPSANPEGLPTARNIKEAENYFGNEVNFYLDGGELVGNPSRLIQLKANGDVVTLR